MKKYEELYDIIFEQSPFGVSLIDVETYKFIDANAKMLELLKYDKKEDVLDHPDKISPEYQPDGRLSFEKANEMMDLAIKNGTHTFEWLCVRSDSVEFWLEVSLTLVTLNGKKVLYDTWKDIDERKKSEELTISMNENFKELFERSSDGIIVADKKFIECNNTILDMLGYDNKEQFLNLHPAEISPEFQPDGQSSIDKSNKLMQECMETGFVEFEWVHKKSTGENFWFHIALNKIKFNNEDAIFARLRDINKEKILLSELEKEKNDALSFLDFLPVGIARNDTTGEMNNEINHHFTEMLGWESTDIETMDKWFANAYPDESYRREVIDIWTSKIEEAKLNGNPYSTPYEVKVACKDGSYKWCQTIYYGHKNYMYGIFINITDRKLIEEKNILANTEMVLAKEKIIREQELNEKYKLLDFINQNVPGMLYQFEVDSEGQWQFTYVSPGCEKIVNLTPQAIMDNANAIVSLMHPDDMDGFKKSMEHSMTTLSNFEWVGRHIVNDKIIWVHAKSNPTKHENGKMSWDGVMLDITNQKQLEEDLIQAEKETKAISEFLANMSHEIRTPMNGIIGMSHLALQTNQVSNQRSYIEKIDKSAKLLLTIVNDVLDFSKIEAGKLEIKNSDFNLRETIDSVISFVEYKIEEKKLNLIVDYDDNIGENYLADPIRISQILSNLLSNAVKFTNKGEISILIKKKLDEQIRFEVRDTGIGINQEQCNNLFKSFSQANVDIRSNYGGTGLGLAISKKLVNLMGGKIWVESAKDIGSNFIVEIKLPESKKTILNINENTAIDLSVLKNAHILVAEDSRINQEVIIGFLNGSGVNIDIANNGQEVIRLFKENQDKYQLILMDLQMPDIDGLEATKIIRKIDSQIPIVALTANVMEQHIHSTQEVGMNDHIKKPIDIDKLHNMLVKFIK